MTGKTTGSEPMFYKAPTIEIVGKEYTMRRLGIFDVTKLARILSSSGGTLLAKLGGLINDHKDVKDADVEAVKSLKDFPVGDWFQAIVVTLPEVAEELVDFLASTVKGFKGDFKDGDQFPLGTELEIVENLLESEDVVAFFASGLRLAKSPSIKKIGAMFSGGKSTSSKKPTAGRTKKS